MLRIGVIGVTGRGRHRRQLAPAPRSVVSGWGRGYFVSGLGGF